MRRLAVFLLLAAPAPAATVPSLDLFAKGFPAGRYEVSAGRAGGAAERICLGTPERLVFAGRPVGDECRVNVFQNVGDRATVGWQCPGGDSGRTELRRDHAGLFVASTNGVSGGLPFVAQAEYRHVGPC
jgi:hypothetical protein